MDQAVIRSSGVSDHSDERKWRVASAAVGILLAGLLVWYRVSTGCGLGALPSTAELSRRSAVGIGLFGNDASHDSLQHAAWPQQAMRGRWTFFNPFTLDPHEPLLVNLVALVVGKVADVLGRTPLEILNGLGLAAAALLPYMTFLIARRLGCSSHAAFVSAVLVAASSGWSAMFELLGAPLARPGIDVSYLDAVVFSTLLCYPLIAAAYLVLALLMLGAAWLDRPHPRIVRLTGLCTLAVGNTALGLCHPYEPAILAGSYALFWLATPFDPNTRSLESRRRGTMIALAVGAAAVTGYYLWLSRQSMWRETAVSAVPVPRLAWVTGYGTLLPLAVIGGVICLRCASLERMRWPLVWVGAVLFLLVGLETAQSKVCAGMHVPLCLLSGVGLEQFHRAVDRSKWRRVLGMSAVAIIWASLVYGNIALLNRMRKEVQYIDSGLLQVARALEVDYPTQPPHVLCSTDAGRRLAAVTDIHVYAANAWRTPRYYERRRHLGYAGVEVDFAEAHPFPVPQELVLLESLIKENDVDEILVEQWAPAWEALQECRDVRLARRYGKWLRYRRIRP